MSDADPEILARRVRPPDRTEVSGPAATDVYDIFEPDPARARGVTVALLHGGFWRERYDRAHLAPLADALARDGFHVANLEYPRVGMPSGGWPGSGLVPADRKMRWGRAWYRGTVRLRGKAVGYRSTRPPGLRPRVAPTDLRGGHVAGSFPRARPVPPGRETL